jgi:predicted metalloprotease
MKWEDLRRSSNLEDLRSKGASRAFGGSGRSNMRLLMPVAQFLLRSNVGRVILAVGVVAYFLGFNPLSLLDNSSSPQQNVTKTSLSDDKSAQFVSVVLAQTEDIWKKIFAKHNARYKEPKLVLFRQSTRSGCGYANAQTGPFYCPADQKVYLDLGFFDELRQRHNAPGDFAQAYVIAHEIGHHVQNLAGTLNKSHSLKARASKKEANALQVKVELQADCYAGIWAHYVKSVMDEGDIQEALNAASAIGDDTLQKHSQGYVVPDAFTHGSSKERMRWFNRGYKSGELSACQTGI